VNYYNEIDPYCAAWLQNLMDAGHIPLGFIDTRSIEDVTPEELREYDQCHFFAGISGWPLALRLAGWPDSRPAWTGSCPCQPFSAAGKGAGFADERHLWPAWQHLIAQCRPAVIFGEQVASKAVDAWIDLVHADLEGMGYAFGAIAFPAAGIGAPHIRDRTYWMANTDDAGLEGRGRVLERAGKFTVGADGLGDRLANAEHDGRDRPEGSAAITHRDESNQWLPDGDRAVRGLANSASVRQRTDGNRSDGNGAFQLEGAEQGRDGFNSGATCEGPGPTNGQWADADWLGCTDGRWRPVEPGTFPLAHGVPGRVGRLRAYGNAIVPAQAAEFVAAFLEMETVA
jgi:DNA (cytosine-5)-methyltransferase 1